MFFFGVLSNTLPYLFLFVLYVVGLGSWLLGKPNVEENTVDATTINTINIAKESNVASGDTVHFFSHIAGTHFDQSEQQVSEEKSYAAGIVHNIIDVSTQFSEQHLAFRLFSRPPPTLS
ncbi:hypothetical protein [Prolixibacter sp. SD074]|uniref:hypothetical protein n=1 Tax=Prolixibacter sp. SD074 TaxID=2652391 RepID=UPI00127662B2|nr:hypothetical protein [Prolixibacter sp. SD074]GET29186.1 hypothetical protein SD074_13880 [Prolixibacter sp. SD074]